MGIDRIAKPGPPAPPPAGAGPTSPATRTERGFGEQVAEAHAARPAEGSPGPLEKLRAGTINLEGYLDVKVQEATMGMAGLPPAQVDAIRSALRERLSTDPTLTDLIRMATGAVDIPSPSRSPSREE